MPAISSELATPSRALALEIERSAPAAMRPVNVASASGELTNSDTLSRGVLRRGDINTRKASASRPTTTPTIVTRAREESQSGSGPADDAGGVCSLSFGDRYAAVAVPSPATATWTFTWRPG